MDALHSHSAVDLISRSFLFAQSSHWIWRHIYLWTHSTFRVLRRLFCLVYFLPLFISFRSRRSTPVDFHLERFPFEPDAVSLLFYECHLNSSSHEWVKTHTNKTQPRACQWNPVNLLPPPPNPQPFRKSIAQTPRTQVDSNRSRGCEFTSARRSSKTKKERPRYSVTGGKVAADEALLIRPSTTGGWLENMSVGVENKQNGKR